MFSSDFRDWGRGAKCVGIELVSTFLYSFHLEGRGVAEDKWQMFLCKSNNRGLFTIFEAVSVGTNTFQLLNHTFSIESISPIYLHITVFMIS